MTNKAVHLALKQLKNWYFMWEMYGSVAAKARGVVSHDRMLLLLTRKDSLEGKKLEY